MKYFLFIKLLTFTAIDVCFWITTDFSKQPDFTTEFFISLL